VGLFRDKVGLNILTRNTVNCCCSCRWVSLSLNSGPTVRPADDMSMESYGGIIPTGENRRTRIKACRSVTLRITNPT
jgi:hypothetical protein